MTIELLLPHTHAGVRYPPGARLNLDDTTARWLIERGVAQSAATPVGETKSNTPSRKGD